VAINRIASVIILCSKQVSFRSTRSSEPQSLLRVIDYHCHHNIAATTIVTTRLTGESNKSIDTTAVNITSTHSWALDVGPGMIK
jgi:hypothetical protein